MGYLPSLKNHWKEFEHPGKTALSHFSAQLFTLCMGTGILAVNLQTLPYQFKGLGILSIIVWIFDLILFFSFVTLFTARWICFPSTTLKHFEDDVEQTTYLSTTAISLNTIIEMTALVLGKTWAGWDTACLVFWWISVVLSLFAALMPLWIIINMEKIEVKNLPPTALYPATAILSCASAGSVVCTYTSLSVRASEPILLMSYFLLGLGFFTALAVLANYTGRLIINGTPAPEKAMASFIPLAAISNAGYSATSLGRLAGPSRNLITVYGQGYAANQVIGYSFYGTGIVIALGLLGFSTYWVLLSLCSVISHVPKAPFTLNYWSALYPLGVYAIAFGQLAMDFDSPTFRTVNTIITLILLLLWLYCLALTIPLMVCGFTFLSEAEEERDSRESWKDRRRLRSSEDRDPEAAEDVEEGGESNGEERQENGGSDSPPEMQENRQTA